MNNQIPEGVFQVLEFIRSPVFMAINAAILLLALLTAVWSYFDAKRRGSQPWAVALMVGLFWPIGPAVWLFIRPRKSST